MTPNKVFWEHLPINVSYGHNKNMHVDWLFSHSKQMLQHKTNTFLRKKQNQLGLTFCILCSSIPGIKTLLSNCIDLDTPSEPWGKEIQHTFSAERTVCWLCGAYLIHTLPLRRSVNQCTITDCQDPCRQKTICNNPLWTNE